MTSLSSEVKVGIFVLLAGAILLSITFTLGTSTLLQRRAGRSLIVYFPSVAGLDAKSPVKVAGVDVGRVENIALEEGRAKVIIRLKRDQKVRANAVASIRVFGLLGEKYIEITGGTPEADFVPDGGVLPTEPLVVDPDLVMAQVSKAVESVSSAFASLRSALLGPRDEEGALPGVLRSVQQLSDELRSLLGENRASLRATLENLEATSGRLRETFGVEPGALAATLRETHRLTAALNERLPKTLASLERVVDSMGVVVAENRASLAATLTSLREATQALPATLEAMETISTRLVRGQGSAGKFLTDEQLYNELRNAIKHLDTTLGRLSHITARIDEGKGTLGALIHDEGLEMDVRESLHSVRGVMQRLKGFRGSFGLRVEQQLEEDRTKGYFSLAFEPSLDSAFLFEAVADPRRRRDRESELEDLRFSFQFARRLGALALRAGVIENTFGVGADFSTWGNRLSFGVDAYDFSGDAFRDRHDDPHLTFRTRLNLRGGFYATAGVDDLLDPDFRTLFLGTGYEFRWGKWRRPRTPENQ